MRRFSLARMRSSQRILALVNQYIRRFVAWVVIPALGSAFGINAEPRDFKVLLSNSFSQIVLIRFVRRTGLLLADFCNNIAGEIWGNFSLNFLSMCQACIYAAIVGMQFFKLSDKAN